MRDRVPRISWYLFTACTNRTALVASALTGPWRSQPIHVLEI